MRFEIVDSENSAKSAIIKVIGIGGGGGNAVQHMIASTVDGVEFICANTDAQALEKVETGMKLQLGGNITKGLGAGANPETGRQAALEDRDRIGEIITGTDMVFITAGMGGGTGTGAAPVIAEIARELGILTVAVVTKPFPFENRKRMAIAEAGIRELEKHVDSLITIPNEKLMDVLGKDSTLLEAFGAANDVLLGAVKGIADLIMRPGMINVDFADVGTVMSEMGMAMMGTGHARGENRATQAAEAAITSPLLEDVNLQGARGILVNITAGDNFTLGEFNEIGDAVSSFASEQAIVVIGTVIDPEMEDRMSVTVVATGLGGKTFESENPEAVPLSLAGSGSSQAGRSAEEGRQPVNFRDLSSRPAVSRRGEGNRPEEAQRQPRAKAVGAEGTSLDTELEDYLDIPSFLRKQAD